VSHDPDDDPVLDDSRRQRDLDPGHVRRVRLGHGANCSSLGSVVDTLFATATVGVAVFAAVVAALAKEPVKIVKSRAQRSVPESQGGRPL
jgi:hypothetical protein